MQPTKDNRATTSCSECQRRKQRVRRDLRLKALRLTNDPSSALANGHAIIVRLEKLHIYVNLERRKRNRNLHQIRIG